MSTTSVIELLKVPPGSFLMGDGSEGGFPQERPLHSVEVAAFHLGRCCVTAGEYFEFISDPNSEFHESWVDFIDPCFILKDGSGFRVARDCEDFPMIQVSFAGAAAYCNWLSKESGFSPVYSLPTLTADLNANGFRLPTEAEWEWACGGPERRACSIVDSFQKDLFCHRDYSGPEAELRASHRRIGGFGLHQESPLPVGTLPPNDFGFHEMLGNVNEWCHDCYRPYTAESRAPHARRVESPENSFRVIRGGSFIDTREKLRTSWRHGIHYNSKCMIDGFRIARNS